MKELEKRILEGTHLLKDNIIRVDSFLNHQIDVAFLNEIAKEFKKRFSDVKVDKILTIEASGIAIAVIASQQFDNTPVVFAKKTLSKNLDKNFYFEKVFSFTKDTTYDIMVSKKYITEGENVLIIDDFLANGKASLALCDIVKKAKANVVGVGVVIEKANQLGRTRLEQAGIRIESLARVDIKDDGIRFK
ncbi:xanthine phosphoribosyltransferase [Oceanivirga miroungae]|uniref:Xanthine phosphoribosyltransferase n=1 Tax=Oceanivirga miroungae TaxID=1130046 RepID=A0A6I8M7G7_9FUSO|nr:xanthine phosphoribosyltransferase [Oceanivirga miroungae]VWL85397.1 Xanthine phosphoribosyltransferase [Oceanivirga miroungae]